VRAKTEGEREAMVSDEVAQTLDELWRQEITTPLGFSTYDDFRAAVNQCAGGPFRDLRATMPARGKPH
jgi:hypothetical protein